MSIPQLSVIIPAYREQGSIVRHLLKINSVLKKIRLSYEIICVVDGYVDSTYLRASNLKLPRMKVIGYPKNMGKGYAVRLGMKHAKGEIIAFIDAGMDINPNGISMILEHYEWYKADVIVGSKLHPVSKVNYPWQRKIMSRVYQFIVWILFGLTVRDTQVGLKVFRKKLIKKILPQMKVNSMAFDIEILALARKHGYKRIFEAPVEIKSSFRGLSSITSKNFLRVTMEILKDTLMVYYRIRP
jgi:glycosyltransferase involved in cell wall biosynthesis